MAIMLPVSPGGLFGDSSLQGAPESLPTDTTNGISSDYGTSSDYSGSGAAASSATSDSPSFHDTLTSTQKNKDPKPPAKDRKTDTAQPNGLAIGVPVQTQQGALGAGGSATQTGNTSAIEEADGTEGSVAVGAQVTSDAAAAIALAANETAAGAAAHSNADTVNSGAASGESAAGTQSAADLHSLSAPIQTLAQSDVVASATRSESKQDSNSSDGGASDPPPQMNWTPAHNLSASASQTGVTADAKVADSGMAERIDVVRQISSQIQASTPLPASSQQTITLNIHPDHWGALTINLTMDSPTGAESDGASSGAITATIIAQSGAVRDALAGQSRELQSALESAGIKLQKLDIITAAAATGSVASSHSASQAGLDSNARNSSFSQHGQQSHSSSTSQNMSGGQGQRQNQQFASLFDGSGRDQPRGGWLPSVATVEAGANSESFTPISLVQATTSEKGLNLLA